MANKEIFDNQKEEELNNIFFKLENYKNILAFDQDEREIDDLLTYVDDEEYIIINCGISQLLKERFIEKYNLEKLPVLISYNINIYNDKISDEILEKRKINENKYLDREINKFIAQKRIVIFIKGTPDKPECKFTKELIDNFDDLQLKNGKDYHYFNIKLNDKWRSRLKEKNNWGTFPQVFIDNLFIGGLDTFKKMKEKNIIQKMIFAGEDQEK